MANPNNFPKFVAYRALAFRFQNDKLLDAAIENADGSLDGIKIVNICFKDSDEFSAEIKRYADLLGVNRREFMKRAIVHAMQMTDAEMDQALEDIE